MEWLDKLTFLQGSVFAGKQSTVKRIQDARLVQLGSLEVLKRHPQQCSRDKLRRILRAMQVCNIDLPPCTLVTQVDSLVIPACKGQIWHERLYMVCDRQNPQPRV